MDRTFFEKTKVEKTGKNALLAAGASLAEYCDWPLKSRADHSHPNTMPLSLCIVYMGSFGMALFNYLSPAVSYFKTS